MVKATTDIKTILHYLNDIKDPEIPIISIIELGIVRNILFHEDAIEVVISPTYSGCPAMDMISIAIKIELSALGYEKVIVTQQLSPAWTTGWITKAGKQKLKDYGIAPPNELQQVCHVDAFQKDEAVQCPQCNSYHTHRISEFGSTACKSLYQCDDCKEPFDYFKCH